MTRAGRSVAGGRIVAVALVLILRSGPARADDPPTETPPPAAAQVDLTKDTKAQSAEDPSGPSAEAPPAAPYKKTVVLDASLGALGFFGQFGRVAPPGPWLHVQLGYELLKWLMLYGEGELAFSDTSNRQAPPNTRAFAMFGFGGGARFSVRFTDSLGMYLQGGLGAMKADIGTNVLGLLGFRDAESLGLYLVGRLGVEWFQVDRHFALGLNAGIRTAQGFARTSASTDTPLALDGGISIRYAF